MAKQFTDAAFEAEVLKADKPVLVDFWAPWCGPCRALGPIVEEVAGEYEGRVIIGKMNVDENPATPTKYGIRAIPTMILFKGGEPVANVVGGVDKAELTRLLDEKALA